jgi:hypothetical protein
MVGSSPSPNPMADFDVCLSSAVIQNIVTDKIEEDFEFFFGGQK